MAAYVLCDRPPIATHLRRVLNALGRECSLDHVFPVDQAKRLPPGSPLEIVFLVAPEDGETTIALIRQIKSVFTGRIVCVGFPQEPRTVLAALHAGADHYVDESGDLESQVSEILLRLEAAGKPAVLAGQLFVVTAASGGVGATTLTSNLAVAFARNAGSCLVVDFASEHGEVADHFNVKPRHTLGDVLRSVDSLDHEVISQSLTPHSSGVSLLAGGLGPRDLADASPGDVERVLRLLRGAGAVCLVDATIESDRRFHLAAIADRMALLTRLDFPSLCNARRRLDEWRAGGVDMSKILLVANRAGQPAEIPAGKVQSFLGQPVDIRISDDPASFNVSINCGIPLLVESAKSRSAQEIISLAKRLAPHLASQEASGASAAGKSPRSLWKRLSAAAS